MKIISSVALLTFLFTAACAQKQKSGDIVEAKAPEKQEQTLAQKNISDQAYQCTVNKDTRLVEFDKSTKRCEIHYTKFGEKMQVAWAENTPSICNDVFAKIRTNIESKGFKCQSLNDTAEQKPAKIEAKRESASIKK